MAGEVFVESQLLQKLAEKKITKETLCRTVEANFMRIPELFRGVASQKAIVRYGCASVLVDLSANYPKELYPYMDRLIVLLDSKYRILIWNAIAAIANLCSVDKDKKFDAVFDKYYDLINDDYLVTVANVVFNSGRIALAKPYLTQRITAQLLKVEGLTTTPHLTEECKKVVAEKAVNSFDLFFKQITSDDKEEVLSFVKRQVNSSRNSLRTKAELFLKRWTKAR